MADHKIGGRTPYRRLAYGRHELARRIVVRIAREINAYDRLPREELTGEITAIVEESLRLFGQVLRRREVPAVTELTGPLTDSAARRAEEGMPLDAVLGAYHLGTAELWRAMVEDARPDELASVLACTELVFGTVRQIVTAVSAAYLAELRHMSSQVQDDRHRLMSALLTGEPPPPGVRLAADYLVVSLSLGAHRDETDPRVNAAIATSRKVGRVRRGLEDFCPGVLTQLDGAGGTALVPGSRPPDEVAALVKAITDAAGVPVTAAAETADVAGVPPAHRQNREILELVARLAYPPRLYRLADVLLEYQLTRPSPAARELAALLDPLAGKPGLLATLDRYLHAGGNRRQTASLLHIHINTLDYRLRRITELTGHNPADPGDLIRLNAALTALRGGVREG